MNNNRLLIVSSYPNSIIDFRGDLIKEFLKKGLEVHVASPNIFLHKHIVDKLKELGVFIHDYSLKRSNTNIFIEIKSLISLLRLIILPPDRELMLF